MQETNHASGEDDWLKTRIVLRANQLVVAQSAWSPDAFGVKSLGEAGRLVFALSALGSGGRDSISKAMGQASREGRAAPGGARAGNLGEERSLFAQALARSEKGSPLWEDALAGAIARANSLGATACEAENSELSALGKLDAERRATVSLLKGDSRVDRAWDLARAQVAEARAALKGVEPWRAGIKAVLALDAPAPMFALIDGAAKEGLDLLGSPWAGGSEDESGLGLPLAWSALRVGGAKCLLAMIERGAKLWPRLEAESGAFRQARNPFAILDKRSAGTLAVPLGVALCKELVELGWSEETASSAVSDAIKSPVEDRVRATPLDKSQAEALALRVELSWREGAAPKAEKAPSMRL